MCIFEVCYVQATSESLFWRVILRSLPSPAGPVLGSRSGRTSSRETCGFSFPSRIETRKRQAATPLLRNEVSFVMMSSSFFYALSAFGSIFKQKNNFKVHVFC